MAIEPISSAMTYQAQSTQVSNNAQRSTETMEGQNIEANAPKIDDDTISIAKSQEKDENSQKGNSQEKDVDQELIRKAMQELSKKSQNVTAEFGIHEKTNRITIKMVDKTTKKVIKELPPEKMLDMMARIWEMSGLIVDEKR